MKYVVQYLYLISRTRRKYQSYLLFNQNAEKIFDNFTIKQNAEKVSETKKEH